MTFSEHTARHPTPRLLLGSPPTAPSSRFCRLLGAVAERGADPGPAGAPTPAPASENPAGPCWWRMADTRLLAAPPTHPNKPGEDTATPTTHLSADPVGRRPQGVIFLGDLAVVDDPLQLFHHTLVDVRLIQTQQPDHQTG